MINAKHETLADIVAEMRDESHAGDGSFLEWVGSKMRSYADRIEAAAKREREATSEKSSQVGNAAAMREALEAVVKVGYPHNFQKEAPHIRGYCCEITTAIKKCFDALSAPPRNCDVGTAEEQERRWRSNCGSGIPNCKHCKVYEQARKSGFVDDKNMIRFDCRFIWSQMPYEEGGAE